MDQRAKYNILMIHVTNGIRTAIRLFSINLAATFITAIDNLIFFLIKNRIIPATKPSAIKIIPHTRMKF